MESALCDSRQMTHWVIGMVNKSDRPTGREPLLPANDNGGTRKGLEDPRILNIAAAIGRKIARDQLKPPQAVNDNRPRNSSNSSDDSD